MLDQINRLKVWIPALCGGSIVSGVLISRFPEFMNHWDEFQLAYGVDDFDLTRHQPHPPGYYLFILAGRALKPLTGEASTALQLVSALSLGLLVALLIRYITRDLTGLCGWAYSGACVAFALLSPLLLNYGTVGLTYVAEAVVLVSVGLALSRASRRGFEILALLIGLSGGLRQNLALWGGLLLAIEMLRHREWISLRRLFKIASLLLLGLILWIAPLLYEAGGWSAWREASSVLLVGNILEKSLIHTGLVGLRGRLGMLRDLWHGLGALLIFVPFLLFARARGAIKHLDSLLFGGLIAFGFYTVLIYDTDGYMVAPVLAWGSWIFLGLTEWLAKQSSSKQRVVGLVLLGAVAVFPILPGIAVADGKSSYTAHARHDAMLRDHFDAVRRAMREGLISPEDTVLLTSREYWRYGLRHVAHYLPEFATVQLAVDRFFLITRPESPYFVARHRRLETIGPDGIALSELLPAGKVKHVIHMIPHDFREFLDGSCAEYARVLTTAERRRLIAIDVANGMTPRIFRQRLICQASAHGLGSSSLP